MTPPSCPRQRGAHPVYHVPVRIISDRWVRAILVRLRLFRVEGEPHVQGGLGSGVCQMGIGHLALTEMFWNLTLS